MKWSAGLSTASIGMRAGSLQVTPSEERLNTMSLDAQRWRKRQSSHATYVVPSPEISAVGSGLVRRSPPTPWKCTLEIAMPFVHDAPPLVERNASILPLIASKGTT